MKITRSHVLGLICLCSSLSFSQEDEIEIEETVIEVSERAFDPSKDLPKPDLSLRTKPTHKYVNDTLWFGYDWNVVEDKTLAHYYRTKPQKQGDLYAIQDHYKDGAVQMKGTFIDFDGNIKHGVIAYYRPNQTLQTKVYYGNDKVLDYDQFANDLHLITNNKRYVNFELPSIIKKTKIEDEESDFSFRDLFDTNKQLREELDFDESVYITREKNNIITTTEIKTGRVVSTLTVKDNKQFEGDLKLFNGKRVVGEVKPNPKTKQYEFTRYHKNGKPFLVQNIENKAMAFFAPNGTLIAENDGDTGSIILGLNSKTLFGLSYISPIAEDQSFMISYLENGDLRYTDQYYRYNVPYRVYDKASGFTREYQEDGTLISEYVNPNKEDLYDFKLRHGITEGYRGILYKSKNLKSKTYYKTKSKIVETYRDTDKATIESKEFYKKEDIDGFYFSAHQIIRYDEKGKIVFEEKVEDDLYKSINYDKRGKVIDSFSCEYIVRASLNSYPRTGRKQHGTISKSYRTDTYEFFELPEYEDVDVNVTFELRYEEEEKKREFLSLNGVVFIDYNWNGESKFYNPIDKKIVTCTFENGQPVSGEYIDYDVSYSALALKYIKRYKDGKIIYNAAYDDSYMKGTHCKGVEEVVDGEEIITSYLGDKTYVFNKTLKDGSYVGSGWAVRDIVEDNHIFYRLDADKCIAEFENGDLLSVAHYQTRFFDNKERKTPNTEQFLLANKSIYKAGKLVQIESYYDPAGAFKELQHKLTLDFNDEEEPYQGEIVLNKYSDEYYRLDKGEVVQKLNLDHREFYEITPEKATRKLLTDRDEISYHDFYQVIEYTRETDTHKYTALDSQKKEYTAVFDGIKMKKGIFFYEEIFEGMYTFLVKDDMVYKIKGYETADTFRETQVEEKLPISSSVEEFESFYGFSSYSSPIQISSSIYFDRWLDLD